MYQPCDDYLASGYACPPVIHVGAPRKVPAECRPHLLSSGCTIHTISYFVIRSSSGVLLLLLLPCQTNNRGNLGRQGLACSNITGCADTLPIQTLLRAAGITNMDTQGDYTDPGTGEVQSHRFSGLIIQIGERIPPQQPGPVATIMICLNYPTPISFWSWPSVSANQIVCSRADIHYTNVFLSLRDMWSTRTDRFKYHYRVSHVKNSEYKGEQVELGSGGSQNATPRVVFDRHGIRMIFGITGVVGQRDMQVSALVAVSHL